MKFTSAPKKMLLTGLSAAMVVAFAPGIAFGDVTTGTGSTASNPSAGASDYTVATLAVDNGTSTTTTPYKSSGATYDDDALQAALVAADAATKAGASAAKVTLERDVAFDGFTSTTQPVVGVSDEGIVVSGKHITLDLNGKTVSTKAGLNVPAITLANGNEGVTTPTAGTTAKTNKVPVYAENSSDAVTTSAYYPIGNDQYKAGGVQALADFSAGTTPNLVDKNGFADDGNTYELRGDGKFYPVTNPQTFTGTKYYKYTVEYTTSNGGTGNNSINQAEDVTIANGTVRPNAGQSAVDALTDKTTTSVQSLEATVYAQSEADALAGKNAYNDDSTTTTAETSFTIDVKAVADKDSIEVTDDGQKYAFAAATSGTQFNQDPDGTYHKFTIKYTVTTTNKSTATITDRSLTLDKAALTSNGADTVNNDAHDTAVAVQDGASVKASYAVRDGDTGKVLRAIEASAFSADQTKAQKDAKESPYASQAAVSAEITGARAASYSSGAKFEAYGVDAGSADVETAIDVSAAVGRDASGQVVDPGTGEATDPEVADAASTAVKAQKVTLKYGNYTADKAVDTDDGNGVHATGSTINYGTYRGYVDGNVTIKGGRFQYKPDRDYGNRSGKTALQQRNVLDTSTNVTVAQNSAEGADQLWYAYRLGSAAVSPTGKVSNPVTDPSGKAVVLNAPEGAKDANGDAYGTDVASYVVDNYLKGYTEAKVFAGDEKAAARDDWGLRANDGNQSGTIGVSVKGEYLAPTDKAAAAGGYEAELGYLNSQATANKQTAQGLYRLAAQTSWGRTKIEDVATLGENAKLAVTAGDVQTNADAKAYQLGAENRELEVSRPQAIADNPFGTATFQTADAGYYGITVTTGKDVKDQNQQAVDELRKQLEEAQGQNAELQKQLADAQAKIDEAQKAIDQAAADADAKVKAAQEASRKAIADVRAVDSAKAKRVSNVKGASKAKKTARVSWSKVKGAVKYQVRYRVEHSSKTHDFRYKTVKASPKTVKALKSGKRYHFSVRVQTKAAGKAYWGKWSSSVCVKVK